MRIHLKWAIYSGRATTRSTSQHRYRNITANENCYRVFPWVEQPARPSRSAHSVQTFRAQLAQEIGIAALIFRSHCYYDWDDCWPPVPHIPHGSFAQNRFRFRFISQHLGTESGDNSRRTKASCKADRGMTTSHFREKTLFHSDGQ